MPLSCTCQTSRSLTSREPETVVRVFLARRMNGRRGVIRNQMRQMIQALVAIGIKTGGTTEFHMMNSQTLTRVRHPLLSYIEPFT